MDILQEIESIPEQLSFEEADKIYLQIIVPYLKQFIEEKIKNQISTKKLLLYKKHIFILSEEVFAQFVKIKEHNQKYHPDKEINLKETIKIIFFEQIEMPTMPSSLSSQNINNRVSRWKEIFSYEKTCQKMYDFFVIKNGGDL